MKQVVILVGPCVRREIMPEINRQIETHQAAGVITVGDIKKQYVRTELIAERLRTSSEVTREKIQRALDAKNVEIADVLISF